MRKNFLQLLIVILCIGNHVQSQSDIKLSSFFLTPMTYNPAYAGNFEGMSFTSLYTSQWLGFDGAPKTFFFNGQGTFINSRTGLGLEVINDEIGVTINTKILGNYSYQLQLNEKWKLAMGLKAGFSSYSVDYSKLNIENPNEIGNSIEKKSWTNYNIGVGFYLYRNDFFLGISAPNLLKNTFFEQYKNNILNTIPNYYLSMGYNIKVDEGLSVQPNILTRVAQGSPMNTLLATTVNWEDKLYTSINVDLNSTIGGFVGFRFSEKYMLGYSYDSSINSFSKNNGGIHSVFMNIRFDDYWKRERCSCNAMFGSEN
jgi:type IX secretion system PorP/SprF family membrane protein